MDIIEKTPIELISENFNKNAFYMKREDLLPFSFGGNKARKAIKFKKDILEKNADIVVTYGSSESNHCRIIANMAKSLNKKCFIISPIEDYIETYNSNLVKMFNAEIIKVPVKDVSETIYNLLEKLSKSNTPYFIPGGGHGNLGTAAYVDCYNEINQFEKENNIKFDCIFFASGTGTTQAGLVCGQFLNNDTNRRIIGISIARERKRGKKIIIESISNYLKNDFDENLVIFDDSYICKGYNNYNTEILDVIKKVLYNDGIALNTTYTGKAYYGMIEYIKKNNIENKNILFINTGGLPLFFDDMKELQK